jgi:hypothetical protein
VWGINTHYDLSDNHPLLGRSVPNFELEDGSTIGEFMHEGQGILLDFDSNASLKMLAVEYGDQIKYVSGLAKDQLGLCALLIRPDGFIAWASDQHPNLAEVQQAVTTWFTGYHKLA